MKIWNNVFLNNEDRYERGSIVTNKDMPTDWITYCDYNLYNPSKTRFTLNLYTGENHYSSVSAWQAATGFDQHSLTVDPMFTDASANNYEPMDGSPLQKSWESATG